CSIRQASSPALDSQIGNAPSFEWYSTILVALYCPILIRSVVISSTRTVAHLDKSLASLHHCSHDRTFWQSILVCFHPDFAGYAKALHDGLGCYAGTPIVFVAHFSTYWASRL